MAKLSTFYCLPNELIVRILGHLNPAENFQSFFNCNDHLRALVKHYVMYSRRALDEDIKRFSTLHSWYKHRKFDDDALTFYMVPLRGVQEPSKDSQCVSHQRGIHWHFWEHKTVPKFDKRIEQIIQKYPVQLNPIFNPRGLRHEILMLHGQDFIRQYYPLQFETLSTILYCKPHTTPFGLYEFYTDDVKVVLNFICKNEPKRLRNIIHEAARSVWKEIQALEDVNILEIECR